jgi:hypothetical protein
MRKSKPNTVDLESPDGLRDFLGNLSNDLIDRLQSIAHDEDDGTKLERATAIVRDAPPAVMALVALSLFATVREHEETIEASNSLLRKIVGDLPDEMDA